LPPLKINPIRMNTAIYELKYNFLIVCHMIYPIRKKHIPDIPIVGK
jgi:hypothetical protein